MRASKETATAQTPVKGRFSGLLVIDLTHVLNRTFGATILGDLGAQIIKIEPPGHGDDTRTYGPNYSAQPLNQNRGARRRGMGVSNV
jgi:CoA:oxalate CoA-transferase